MMTSSVMIWLKSNSGNSKQVKINLSFKLFQNLWLSIAIEFITKKILVLKYMHSDYVGSNMSPSQRMTHLTNILPDPLYSSGENLLFWKHGGSHFGSITISLWSCIFLRPFGSFSLNLFISLFVIISSFTAKNISTLLEQFHSTQSTFSSGLKLILKKWETKSQAEWNQSGRSFYTLVLSSLRDRLLLK